MSPSAVVQLQDPYSPAMVFTSRAGQVVFLNRKIVRLFGNAISIQSAGVPLQKILPVLPKSVDQLINSIQKNGYGFNAQFPVSMPILEGKTWKSTCKASATFDAKGEMIGIDLVLETANPTTSIEINPAGQTHAQVVMLYAKDVLDESRAQQSGTYIQSYLIAQLEVMQIMLARVGGPASRTSLEHTIARTANQYVIPCNILNGHITFTEKNIDIQKYSVLVQSAIRYAIDVVGKQIVKQEMMTVDKFFEPGLLQLVSQLDLKAIFND
jgi:hypothetical protein